MTKVIKTSSILIQARPEVVFAYISDLMRHPEWSAGPLKMEAVSGGPVAVGSQYRSVGGPNNRVNDLRVTWYEPPKCFAFTAKDARIGEIAHEFTLQPQDGGTRLERKVTGMMPPLIAILFQAILYPLRGKPQMEKSMNALKAKLEQPTV
jgi:uncharacterized protein YndB with AHSA1/START domain